jgi:anti-anti-sigma factor
MGLCDNLGLSNRFILMSDRAAPIHLTLAIDRIADVVVVHCSGRLVTGTSDRLGEVRQIIPGPKRIVLDFKDLTHMDSTGIGALVRLYVSAKSAGCVLEVINMGKSVRQLLGITHVLSMLESIGEHNIRMG